jgi:hypothetical protein
VSLSTTDHDVRTLLGPDRRPAEYSVWSLSAEQRCLVVTSYRTHDLWLFHPMSGRVERRVTSPHIRSPKHAVEMSSGMLAVAHLYAAAAHSGSSNVDDAGDGGLPVCVSVVTYDGRTIRRFAFSDGSWDPFYLSLDGDDRIFVGDWCASRRRHRVLLLNCHLQLEQVLVGSDKHEEMEEEKKGEKDEDGLIVDDLSCLLYLKDTGCLVVGSERSKCVQLLCVR